MATRYNNLLWLYCAYRGRVRVNPDLSLYLRGACRQVVATGGDELINKRKTFKLLRRCGRANRQIKTFCRRRVPMDFLHFL